MGNETIISALVASLASLIASLFSALTIRKKKAREERLKNIFLSKFEDQWVSTKSLDNYKQYLNAIKDYINIDYKNFQQRIIFIPSELSNEEIEIKVKQRIDDLKIRIEEIENRFPKDSTIEKIASVNDAILATNIESIAETLKKIENRILTKWDVAKIVFQIIAGLGVIVGLVFGILQYFKGS